jgi:dTDP-4-amino-4,6-dideoxygalactose transaminase
MYYVLVTEPARRTQLLSCLSDRGINAVSHYVPLHSSPAGRRFGRVSEGLDVTERIAAQLVRLPLWIGMTMDDIAAVIDAIAHWAATPRIEGPS